MRRRADGNFPVVPPELDFRKLSRNADKIETTVVLWTDYERSVWIRFGEIVLRERDSHNHRGIWRLGAYLQNATDFEHDSAWLLKFELVGVEFTSIDYGQIRFQGYVKADDEDDFRVGNADYNPLAKAKSCKGTQKEYCRLGEPHEPHVIVLEGFYVPPPNPDLFNIVRGRRVEIVTGPVTKQTESP